MPWMFLFVGYLVTHCVLHLGWFLFVGYSITHCVLRLAWTISVCWVLNNKLCSMTWMIFVCWVLNNTLCSMAWMFFVCWVLYNTVFYGLAGFCLLSTVSLLFHGFIVMRNINTCENGWLNFSENLRIVAVKLLKLTQFASPNHQFTLILLFSHA